MRFHILVVAGVFSIVSPVQAQNWPGRSVRIFAASVEVLDTLGAAPRRLYSDTSAWAIWTPAVSPTGALVGVVRMEKGIMNGTGYGVAPYPTTLILDAGTGAERLRIPGGYAFTWCGDTCIAVVYGVYSEGSEVGPYGDSAAIYDVATRRRRVALHRERGVFYSPRWIPGDSSVIFGGFYGGPKYRIRDGAPLEWDGPSPELSGSRGWAIRRGEGEVQVVPVDGSADSTPVPLPGRWQVEEWLGQTDKVLLLELAPRRILPRGDPGARRVRPSPPRDPSAPPPDRTYRIWDLATGEVSEEWKAAETPWRGPAPNGCRLFLKEGRLTAAPGCR